MTKRTLATTLRVDARKVAAIAAWMQVQGKPATTLGGLVREAVELLADIIEQQSPELAVTTTTHAVEILRQQGLIDLTKPRKFRNHRTLVEALATEDLAEISGGSFIPKPTPQALRELDAQMERASGEGEIANEMTAQEMLENLKRREEKS